MRIVILIALCAAGVIALADGTGTGVQWPGWRIMTSEEVGGTRYPITSMLDGNPATAWVYHKARQDPSPDAGTGFRHGAGTHITIDTSYFRRPGSFVADGLGLINGYAKNEAVYRRNNRITKIHVYCLGNGGQWGGTFTLQQTQRLQRIAFPHRRWRYIDIAVEAVAAGPDDDLCISELVLYCGGKPVPWQVTPGVLFNNSDGCGEGGGLRYALLRIAADDTLQPAEAAFRAIRGIAMQPESPRVLWYANGALYLYDMRRNAVLLKRPLARVIFFGWVNSRTAFIATAGKRGNDWHRLDSRRRTVQPCRAPGLSVAYRTEAILDPRKYLP